MSLPVTILLLDDEPLLRRATALLLSNRGGRVTAASSIEEAVTLAASERYDVAIFDLSATAPSAAEVLDRMRARGPVPSRVIAVSDGALDESVEAEFTAVLQKPYPFDRLMHAVFGGRGRTAARRGGRVAGARSAARAIKRGEGRERAAAGSAPRSEAPHRAPARGGRTRARAGAAARATSQAPRRAPRAARGRG
jgi:CheY-like chemotaxis protein